MHIQYTAPPCLGRQFRGQLVGRSCSCTIMEGDDPLEIKKLAVSFDYLMYKIKDRVSTLCDSTYEAVSAKNKWINADYLDKQLNISGQIEEIDDILRACDAVENQFMRLEQLEMFVADFNRRLARIEAMVQNEGK